MSEQGSWSKSPKPGKLDEQLADLFAQGVIPRGKVTIAKIYHDDDCPLLSGGECACVPDIVLDSTDE